ncbi:MAG: TatD family hydrolase [Candidatus Micrarchaeaceae archaeon]
MYKAAEGLGKTTEAIEATDAHCHLNLFEDNAEIVKASAKAGVGTIITAGSDLKSNFDNAKIAEGMVFAVVGIDPEFALVEDYRSLEAIEKLLKSGNHIVGVGEIGLDYKKATSELQKERQQSFFKRQLEMAKDFDLPVVVHSRDALDEVLDTLERFDIKKAMLHYFEGGPEQAVKAASKGYLISVPPLASRKRDRAIRNISLERIVAETDSPVVGKTPADVLISIRNIAEAKGIGFGEVVSATTSNAKEFFYI